MTHPHWRRRFWLPVLIVTVTAGACGEREPAPVPGTMPEPAADSAARFDDAWITTKIRAQYFTDEDVSGLHVVVNTTEGVVSLKGFVDDARAREQAVAIARNTDGVRDVIDELIENPERATKGGDLGDTMADTWLTARIQARYFADPDVRSSTVDVTAANGVVLLTGTVESEESRQKAVAIAGHTEGVSSVIDSLQVGTAAATPALTAEDWMSDRAITTRVQSKFFLDDEVKGRRINVDTAGGVVTLEGQVASTSEERQAVALARGTYGVKEVVEKLDVVAEPASRAGERTITNIGGTVTDAWITVRVQSKFFLDDQVRGGDINVDTANGVVTLKGVVPSAEVKSRATDLARGTSGVRAVVDELSVAASRT